MVLHILINIVPYPFYFIVTAPMMTVTTVFGSLFFK